MKVKAVEDYEQLSDRAASLFIAAAKEHPEGLYVLPTGKTPEGLFRALVKAHRAGMADFSRLRFVTLDEYAGIGPDDRRCLLQWLRRELFDPLDVSPSRVAAFNPSRSDSDAEAARIESVISDWGGIDLAVVGLGPNGHIGFNEPESPHDSRARRVALTAQSIRSNARYWGSEADVPRFAFTLGLGTLLEARSIVLAASGYEKAEILARSLKQPIDPALPATALRLHRDFTVLADTSALAEYQATADQKD